jgi:hypothetical protein
VFWKIDYAAMDFSHENAFSVQKLSPVKVTDEGGKDVMPLLQKDDGLYLEQTQIGNVATLVYKTTVLWQIQNDNKELHHFISSQVIKLKTHSWK